MQSIKSNSEKNLLMSQVSMFEMICKKCAIHQNLLTQQTCQATRSKVIPCISNYIALHNDTGILQESFWNVCLQVYNVIIVCVHGSSVPPLGCCRQWLFWILTQRVTFETWLTWCNDKKIKIWQIKRQQGKKDNGTHCQTFALMPLFMYVTNKWATTRWKCYQCFLDSLKM